MELVNKQRIFIESYLQTWNATEAARVAGYTHPNKQGPRLLTNAKIRGAINHRLSTMVTETNTKMQELESRFHIVSSAKKSQGYVYFIQVNNGPIKIGKTTNIAIRLRNLNAQIPYELELIHLIPCSNCHDAELVFHSQFASKRIKGEWFNLNPEDVSLIRRIKELP